MNYQKPNLLCYRLTQAVSQVVASLIFKRKVLRNEIKGVKGPFVIIANHQAAYDFVNLIGMCSRPMSFVISNSFYQSLPIKGFLNKLGVIPKQQFQTNTTDLKKIRTVIQAGEPVVIYPAGLMCEDGLSTPIPAATCKLLKWLGVHVYMAKVSGTYVDMPKWTSGFRPGKTTLDVYKLFDKEELKDLEPEAVRTRMEEALLFDAYREQEQLMVKYRKGDNLRGLENVLYVCPHCGKEFTIAVQNKNTLCCQSCGYSQTSDEYGFLHKNGDVGEEIRYVSDWSRWIYDGVKEKLSRGGRYGAFRQDRHSYGGSEKEEICGSGAGDCDPFSGEFPAGRNSEGGGYFSDNPHRGIPHPALLSGKVHRDPGRPDHLPLCAG